MQSIDQHIQWYLSKFQTFEQGLNGEKSTPIHSLRQDAIRRFGELGFPTNQQEEWRFTNIAPITKIEFQPILQYESNGIEKKDIQDFILNDTIHLVFLNGMYSSKLSDITALPRGLMVGGLAETSKKYPEKVQPLIAKLVKGGENAFTALNTAFLRDGGFVSVSEDVAVDRPIQFLFVSTKRDQAYAAQPRNLIIVGARGKLNVIETYVGIGQSSYFTNVVTEIMLEENSVLEHDKLQMEGEKAFHIGTTQIQMNASTRYTANSISLGASITRNTLTAVLDAEGCECTLNGLSIGLGNQTIDNHTAIDHAKPQCNSHELYKTILDGSAKGIFNGKIFVRKDAQKTDAKQTNKTLLLSDEATINAKPQLEIFADDVKCTHGATIGQLDDEQLFYLQSRGIDAAVARDILTTAFAGDIINKISFEPLRRQIEKLIHGRLQGGFPKNG
jgi:Fe-S cluster assembly protein SufD